MYFKFVECQLIGMKWKLLYKRVYAITEKTTFEWENVCYRIQIFQNHSVRFYFQLKSQKLVEFYFQNIWGVSL